MIRIITALILLTLLLPCGAQALTTEALLDTLQHTAFDYFWNEANPTNGLIKDRSTPTSPCSIASLGFGLTAICIGIDHGWVTREAGRERILTALETLWNTPQGSGATGYIGHQGFYYHFLDMNTATRAGDSELSTIDTALLFAGILDAEQYFQGADSLDARVRALADSIVHRADWEFMRNSGVGIRMGWKPGTGFLGFGNWVGYNEAMIMYILALGSPTHPVLSSTWFTWTSGYGTAWSTQYGQTYLIFPPLFGHQYSHCWIDYRNIQDAFMRSKDITYFENSRRATYAQQAYCIANPGGWIGYGASLWGLTASDDPLVGYQAHGAPPPQNDNGTITPTAAASSIAFAPEIVIPTLHYMYDSFQVELWSIYGFKDAFNLTYGWWDTDYIGIDQGPIIIMIENYLNGSVWERFMEIPEVQAGLQVAGFLPVTGVEDEPGTMDLPVLLLQNAPNPFRSSSIISYSTANPGHVSLLLFDVLGRPVQTLVDGQQAAGTHDVRLEGRGLPSGVYFYELIVDGWRERRRCTLLR
jgi:hypothetical protein